MDSVTIKARPCAVAGVRVALARVVEDWRGANPRQPFGPRGETVGLFLSDRGWWVGVIPRVVSSASLLLCSHFIGADCYADDVEEAARELHRRGVGSGLLIESGAMIAEGGGA